ncbi:uncharacterized protein LOC132783469 [Drosophila nasuta]|uniref:uncharacterized protein LOC132783469 n=1 Tax=Drosophila nasuta TaxID=42062 RepID=UPI00295E971B|nr:uncharacterized protein LOC132783469 [Drosophila nasuta]
MDTIQSDSNTDENERIIELQELIDQNIQIENQIETCTFGESITALHDIMSKANDIVQGYEERRTNSRELVLDTELLRRNHEVVGKAIQYNTNFTDRMFCTAVNNLVFKDNVENWDALCTLACQFGRPLFTSASMLSFIDAKPKEAVPKQRVARKSTKNIEEKRPDESDKLERKSKGEGSAAVRRVMKQVKHIYSSGNNEPIPYFKLICNPHNFMDTVQNSLIISILVKENMISIENGNDGLPYVTVNSMPKESSTQDSSQAICGLNDELCKKYVKHYNIKEPMLNRGKLDEH